MSSVYCQNVQQIKKLINTHYKLLSKKFDIILSPTNSRYDIIQVIGNALDIQKFKLLFKKLEFDKYIYDHCYLLDIPNDKYGKLVRNINKGINKTRNNNYNIIIPRKEHKNSKVAIYYNYNYRNQGIKELRKLLKMDVDVFNLFGDIETNNTYTPPYQYIKSNYGLYGNIGEPYIDQFKVGDGDVYQGIPLKGQYGSIGPSNYI
jgi:mRNA-degrading endonuclease RelE of RelBE toxin-antitoxin system